MRFVIAAAIGLAVAAPAVAQEACRTSSPYGDVSGVIRGTALESLTTRSGPLSGSLAPDATATAFTHAPGASSLFYYRVGASVRGRDWREPGSVATEDGGLFLTWPDVLLGGAPAPDIIADLQVGYMRYSGHILRNADEREPAALFLRLDSRLEPPALRHHLVVAEEPRLSAWRDAFINAKDVRLDLYDASRAQHIATITFSLTDRAQMQQELIASVNMLRQAIALKTCG